MQFFIVLFALFAAEVLGGVWVFLNIDQVCRHVCRDFYNVIMSNKLAKVLTVDWFVF